MNWLQKISFRDRDNTFFLLNGDFVFFPCLHSQYLTRTFGISMTEGEAFRFLFPRGRATGQGTYEGVLIEASAELQPYQQIIADRLGLDPMDRPQWDFNNSHYQVTSDLAREREKYSFSPQAKRFLNQYAPNLLELQV